MTPEPIQYLVFLLFLDALAMVLYGGWKYFQNKLHEARSFLIAGFVFLLVGIIILIINFLTNIGG